MTDRFLGGDVMTVAHHVYGEIDSKADLTRVFRAIRRDVDEAGSRPSLTELYKRAGYLITLTYAPSWEDKFGARAPLLRKAGQDEFRKTVKKINKRAKQVGTEPDYDETWGSSR
jgi:hypothetical protein